VDEPTREFLERQRLAHLATVDASGAPHVVPVCFAPIDDTLYIAIDEKPKRAADVRQLRRMRNIADNPRVAIVADVYDDDWSRLGFVLLRCRARIVEPATQEHIRAIAILRQKYVQYRDMALEERPVIAADVQRVTTWGRLEA